MRFASLSLFIVLIPLFLIAVLIGVYVYKDASRRGMNAALWTIVSVFAPALIGLIIYLLVRGGYSDLNCPRCAQKVSEEFAVCPRCGAKLKAACKACAYPCEPDWTVCPKCASPLSHESPDVTPPVQKNDRTLGRILIAVVVTPLVLLFFIIALSMLGFSSTTGAAGATFLPVEEYAAEKKNPAVTEWINSCDGEKQEVYALRYTAEEDGRKITSFAVYFPFDKFDGIDTSMESGLFRRYAAVKFGGDARKFTDRSYNFLLLTFDADSYLTLKATYNGQEVPCAVTDVAFDPALAHDKRLSK